MSYQINKAAVLGSGVMGSAIAAHLANVGIPCYLLDLVPSSLTAAEESRDLTLNDPEVRNRLARNNLSKIMREKPNPFYCKKNVDLITIGNLTDDLAKLAEVDWIIEVVVEKLAVKQELLAKVGQYRKRDAIVSSNTSGIAINKMGANVSIDFQQHFLGTHFFNPPRYMKLLEIIPGDNTLPQVVNYMKKFCEEILGKGVVIAKDTPNFIANRLGIYGIIVTLQLMQKMELSITEVDAITGPALGRPKSASFRTLDLVGLDTLVHVAKNIHDHLENDEEKSAFILPKFINDMVDHNWLGQKSGQGFYKKCSVEEKTFFLALNYKTLEYQDEPKPNYQSLATSKAAGGLKAGLQVLVSSSDRAGQFAWQCLKKILLYAGDKMNEIADSLVAIDNAMKWGFNWQFGPFELWDVLGLEKTVGKMRKEGEKIPEFIEKMLTAGKTSFYKIIKGQQYYYSPATGDYVPKIDLAKTINLMQKSENNKVVMSNQGSRLVDIGEGVFCLEFTSPNNAIGGDILTMINKSIPFVVNNGVGLVIGNQGRNFCVGANLMLILMEAQDENWDEIDFMIRMFQKSMLTIKYSPVPVIAAPFNMTLGGGCEVVFHCHRTRAAAETYLGLVELGVGLIPAGGGTKEGACKAASQAGDEKVHLQPFVNKIFETIAMAKVSTSAQEAKEIGLLQQTDKITVNNDMLIHDAKESVLSMIREGFEPLRPEPIRIAGTPGLAVLKLATYTLNQGGYISKYDRYLANKLAYVLTGGDLPANTFVSEEYLLELEREAFLSLCGDSRTQVRMQHMLAKGKPLRN